MSERLLEAARFMIRCALEDEACWVALHGIVEDERARAYPESSRYGMHGLGRRKPAWVYSGPVAQITWDSRRAA